MKKLLFFSLFSILICSSALALQPAVIGGLRNGIALGVIAEEPMAKNISLRFGAELDTGNQPIIIFFGGKFYLTKAAGTFPLYLGLHVVAFGGNRTIDAGPGISLIFDHPFNIKPLFFECGVEIAGSGRLQAQAGYKIF